MGYMGFGMKKEVYARKPKTSFAKLKRVYGEELRKRTKSNSTFNNQKLSPLEKEKIKKRIKKEIRRKNLKTVYVILVPILLMITVSIIFKYVFSEASGFMYFNGQLRTKTVVTKNGNRIKYHFYQSGFVRREVILNIDGDTLLNSFFSEDTHFRLDKNYQQQ